MEKANMTQDQRLKIISECGKASYEHFLELYGFDAQKEINPK